MNRALALLQAEADAWLSQHRDWAAGIPDPESWESRIMVDVPKNGRRKCGTHRLPPEKRRKRSAKVVNGQLLRWNASATECGEADEFNAAVSERINRKRDFAMQQYTGKYKEVLSLLLLGLPTKRIAEHLGKTPRRIRQIVNGNSSRETPGLKQFISSLCEPPPDVGRTPRLTVAGVEHGI
ncbi:MAG: hypothetical protein ACYCY0_04540 [Acidithiobacillus ferrivorans]